MRRVMEKTDAIIALVGGAVLLAAVAGVYVAQPDGGAPYDVAFVLDAHAHPIELGSIGPGQGGSVEGALEVGETNVHRILLNVTVTPMHAFAGGSVHVAFTDPNGTVHETERAITPSRAPVVIPLDVLVAPIPMPREAALAPGEDVNATIPDSTSRAAIGTWTLVVSYSSGLAVSSGVDVTAEAGMLRWRAVVTPDVDAAK